MIFKGQWIEVERVDLWFTLYLLSLHRIVCKTMGTNYQQHAFFKIESLQRLSRTTCFLLKELTGVRPLLYDIVQLLHSEEPAVVYLSSLLLVYFWCVSHFKSAHRVLSISFLHAAGGYSNAALSLLCFINNIHFLFSSFFHPRLLWFLKKTLFVMLFKAAAWRGGDCLKSAHPTQCVYNHIKIL